MFSLVFYLIGLYITFLLVITIGTAVIGGVYLLFSTKTGLAITIFIVILMLFGLTHARGGL